MWGVGGVEICGVVWDTVGGGEWWVKYSGCVEVCYGEDRNMEGHNFHILQCASVM